MRLHRFYLCNAVCPSIDPRGENTLSDPELLSQLRRVFRLHPGDKAIFFDDSGDEFESEIVSMTRETLVFRVLETRHVKPHATRRLSLAVSLIKKDNFEWVIQKGTELGVAEFIPLLSERSEKKSLDMKRAQRIMIEAVEQSGRTDIPILREPVAFEDFMERETRGIVAFHTEGVDFRNEDFPAAGEMVACIGPEGGWSESEAEAFKRKGAAVVRLDAPILRAETAAVAAATLLLIA